MPFDANGNYSLPAVYLAEDGTTIQSAQHNTPLEDVQAAMNSVLLRSGVAPMTGPAKITDGTAAAPSVQFASAPTTGFYKTTTGIGLSVSGSQVADITSTTFYLANCLLLKDGGDIASATALTLGSGNIFNITGTTASTSISTKGVGALVWLRSNGAWPITHHATNLILLGSKSIVCAAGDFMAFEEYAVGQWRMVAFHRASGAALEASLPRGYIDGCILSNGTDAVNDINVGSGVCRDSTNAVNITVTALAGKRLDAGWVPGAGNGMRDSANSIADGTYHIYAVAKADGTQDIYAHTSDVVATVIAALQIEDGGAGYLYARMIGSIVRSGATILGFKQYGDTFTLDSPVLDVSTGIGTTPTSLPLPSVPNGIRVEAMVNAFVGVISTGAFLWIYPTDVTDAAVSQTAAPLASVGIVVSGVGSVASYGQIRCRTDIEKKLRFVASGSITARIATLGWVHPRGKDA